MCCTALRFLIERSRGPFTAIALLLLSAAIGRGAPAGYTDSKICAACHPAIARSFAQTGMGRSFYRLTRETQIEDFSSGNSFDHAASGMHFKMVARNGRYYQQRDETGFEGRSANAEEKSIDYVLGSGHHARTYLHRTSRGTLEELPLGWYAENGGHWGMNPGYDKPDQPGSQRTIAYDCMFCHNAYPKIPAANEMYGAEAVFEDPLPEGIDCQRCHGPGSLHVRLGQSGGKVDDVRRAIVNPKRLSTERQMEVCLQCHLETTSAPLPHAIVRFGRAPFSYQPGEPLANFMLAFDRSSGSQTDSFQIAHSAYRLRKSACFLKSGGALQCTTCHDPHTVQPAVERYNTACLSCHKGIGAHAQSGNCVSCHMPKRRTDDVVHAVMTDHFIRREKPGRDLLAEIPEQREYGAPPYRGPVVPYYPKVLSSGENDQLDFAVAQVQDGSNPADGIPLLTKLIAQYRPVRPEYYLELAEALRNTGRAKEAIAFYDQAIERQPDSPFLLRTTAAALLQAGEQTKALTMLDAAVRSASSRDAASWNLLGQLRLQSGDRSAAVAALTTAIQLDSEAPDAHNTLALAAAQSGGLDEAEREFREAIRIWPRFTEAIANLANVLSLEHKNREAAYCFEKALALNPEFSNAHLNYALLLYESGDIPKAVSHLERAARSQDPAVSRSARQFLARISGKTGTQ